MWNNEGRKSPRSPLVFGAVLAAALLAACTPRSQGGDITDASIANPLALKLTWFRYLGGEDIRQACGPGAPERYRFIYNGNYNEQLRAYEVVPQADGGAALTARVLTGSGIATTINLTFDDVLASWRWTTAQAALSRDELARLRADMSLSGLFGPAPVGERLYSNAFYWVASGCRGGVFSFNAWVYPSARYAALAFPEALLQFDRTGIALNPPRERDIDESFRATSARRAAPQNQAPYFVMEIGANGLRGI